MKAYDGPSNFFNLYFSKSSEREQKNKHEQYYIGSHAFNSLKIKDFDYTWADEFFHNKDHVVKNWKEKYNYEYINNKHKFDLSPIETVYEKYHGVDVKYYYNNDFFRCDEFIKKHDGLHVLFSGCSNTEGMGLPIELTWTKMLLEKINNVTKTSGYFNLGKSGNGWQKILNSFKTYVEKYGAPDYFFVLLPNLLRDYYWTEEKKMWDYKQYMPLSINLTSEDMKAVEQHKEKHPEYEMLMYEKNMYFNSVPAFLVAWRLLEDFCKTINTKLIYSTWDSLESGNLESAANNNILKNFYNVAHIPYPGSRTFESFALDSRYKDHVLFLQARDGHPGILQQEIWAYNFFEIIKNDILKKDKND